MFPFGYKYNYNFLSGKSLWKVIITLEGIMRLRVRLRVRERIKELTPLQSRG